MADIVKNVQLRMSQVGAQEAESAIRGFGRAEEDAGRSTSRLRDLIREERTEKRFQTFAIREGTEAMGAMTRMMGQNGGALQGLTRQATEAFYAFDSLKFALAALGVGGGIGIALAGLAAFAAMLSTSAKDAKELNTQLEHNLELELKLGFISSPEYMAALQKKAGEAKQQFEKAQQEGSILNQILGFVDKYFPIGFRDLKGAKGLENISKKILGADEQTLATAWGAYLDRLDKIFEFRKKINDEESKAIALLKTEVKEVQYINEEQKKRFEAGFALGGFLGQSGATRQGLVRESQMAWLQAQLGGIRGVKGGLSLEDEAKRIAEQSIVWLEKENELTRQIVTGMGETLQSELGGAFEAVFGEANSLLEKFGQRLFEILGNQLIGNVLGMLFPWLFPGGAGGAGGGGTVVRDLGNPVSRSTQYMTDVMKSPTYSIAAERARREIARLGRAA